MSAPLSMAEHTHLQAVHRRVVRVGAVVAWLVAAVVLILGLFTGDSDLLLEASVAGLAGALMTVQILVGRENGTSALFGSGIVIVVSYAVLPDPGSAMPQALALVVMAGLGMLFVHRRRLVVGLTNLLVLLATPFAWDLPPVAAVTLGAVMAGGFTLTAAVLLTVRSATAALDMKFRILFERSPTALLEEDWTGALDYVRYEYTGSPERLRQLLLAYPEVVRRAVSKARIVSANRAAVDLLEAPDVDSLLGERNPAKVDETNIEAYVGALDAMYQGLAYYQHEFPTDTFTGRHVLLQARCVDDSPDEHPSRILVALADITHLRAREESLSELVRAKDSFVASISHELRTPLTAVLGLTTELVRGGVDEEDRTELMRLVHGQAEEMANIVEDLLVAARAEMGPIAVGRERIGLMEQLLLSLEGVDIGDVDVPDHLPMVEADPKRVRQILRNLLTNLGRYGGPHRRVLGGQTGERAWLEIRDDGPGVPAEDVERIFLPYASSHTGVAGSMGLGLPVARQLAEAMDGSLRFLRDGAETVFRLELPLAGE